jgi:hypothetical protein
MKYGQKLKLRDAHVTPRNIQEVQASKLRDVPEAPLVHGQKSGHLYSMLFSYNVLTFAFSFVLLAAINEMEVMGTETADQYKSLVAQRVLSVQLSKAEHDQRHNLFQTRGVVKDRAIRIIIDGGSCNNLASIDMVENLLYLHDNDPIHITFSGLRALVSSR